MKGFLKKLALDRPTPGGGSASAMAGALSASLVAMVAGLSSKKDKRSRREMAEVRKKAWVIQRRLALAVDQDADTYNGVIKAFQLPRKTEKDRLHRRKSIVKAYKRATVTPQLVCRQSIQLLDYSRLLILKGNPNAVSDAGVAALLADAALAGGLLNIGSNLVPVTEGPFLKKMRLLMREWAKKRNRLMGEILDSLMKVR